MREGISESPGWAGGRRRLLTTAAVLFGAGFLLLATGLLPILDDMQGFGGTLLPVASLLTGGVILAPTLIEYRAGRFDPFHPLTFAAWSYLFPAFCVGGLLLTFGWNRPYFLSFIDDPQYTLPLALAYVSLGVAGMTMGFYLPGLDRLVSLIDERMPNWEWRSPGVFGGGLVLVLLGLALNILGFVLGLLGYQRAVTTGQFDALIVFLSQFFAVGSLLLWLAFFGNSDRSRPLLSYLIVGFLVVLIPVRLGFSGSRSELLGVTVALGMAFWYSGRQIRRAHYAMFGAAIAVSLVIGVVWSSTFRNIKGSEARMAAGQYVEQMVATGEYLMREDPEKILSDNVLVFLERIETLSSLGVVVSNYEKLAPYEEAYGLRNNITNDLLTAFIPRFMWADKPPVTDPRAFSDLYFNYPDNSFAVTPFGDLLRNFGVTGIFAGMLLIGIYLRLIYGVLIDTDRKAIWKKMAYLPLLTVVTFEGSYASFVPSLIRVFFVGLMSALIVQFLIGRGKSERVPPPTVLT